MCFCSYHLYMNQCVSESSTAVGIGMLLAFTGLRNLGLITFDSATLVTLVSWWWWVRGAGARVDSNATGMRACAAVCPQLLLVNLQSPARHLY